MAQTLSPGTKISHFEIRKRLGTGGMGEVYLAYDTKLERNIALKILPPEIANNRDRMRRFVQEAKAAAVLNHPNIVNIYESGSCDERNFIAMELIEGKTLRECLDQGRLKVLEALDISSQIASALSTTHGAGIIHRDLKPENLMLRLDGHVKVLDFGVAKLVEENPKVIDQDASTITRPRTDPGTVVGTLAYMSPEQAKGLSLDERTDIFSLGVVMYEMITGRHPFLGNKSSDLHASILDKEPLPLAHFSTETPPQLEWILTKALSKEREERYQTAKDFLIDLKRLKRTLDMEVAFKRTILPDMTAKGPGDFPEAFGGDRPGNNQNGPEEQDRKPTPAHAASPLEKSHERNGELGRDEAISTGFSISKWLSSDLRFTRVQGIGVLLVVLLCAITVYYFYSVNKPAGNPGVQQNPENSELVCATLQDKLDKTLDSVSLLVPNDEDTALISDVKRLRERYDYLRATSKQFAELSTLAEALQLMAIEREATKASDQVDKLKNSENPFVASRARLLQAATLFYPVGLCSNPDDPNDPIINPDNILKKLSEVIEKDSTVAAAHNLRGVCLAEKSMNLLLAVPGARGKKSELWNEGLKSIVASLKANDDAYRFSPSTKLRFLNNEAYVSLLFLSGVVPLNRADLQQGLKKIGNYEDMEDFFAKSLAEIDECLELSKRQATYLETKAERFGLEYLYRTDGKYKNDKEAEVARQKVFENLEAAINNNLLKIRKLKTLEAAEGYFAADRLLVKVLFADPNKPDALDEKIKALIVRRLADQ